MKILPNYPTTQLPNYKAAYTLIELLIVLSLIGIATALVTTAYLSFERRERVKASALELQNNIRLAQNNAHSGYKGFEGDKCDTAVGEILIGWFVAIDGGLQTYTIAGDCLRAGVEDKFGEQTFRLARDVNFNSVSAGSKVNILYRPLTQSATFHDADASGSFVDFIDETTGDLKNLLNFNEINMDLKGPSPYMYRVKVNLTGGVSAKKI